MVGRYMLVGLTHVIGTAFILKILSLILPNYFLCQYTCAANILMVLMIAKLTFGFTKKNFLNEKIQPDNRAVLITGCDTGFGNALARQLDKKGFHVFASCYNDEGEGAKELKKECSKRLQVLSLDVTQDDSVQNAVKFVKENLGTSELWTVVNNAGVYKGFSVELTSIDEFKDSMEVNALGVVRVTKAFLPLLRQSRGRVVNLTSLSARIPVSHMGPYTMSKHAAVAFTECLRQEMEVWGIKVISIEPEFFQTPMTDLEGIISRLDNTFQSISADVKSDYGEKYLKSVKIYMEYNTNFHSPKIYKVVNALELAISLEHPDTVYRPCRNIIFKMLFSLYIMLPDIVRDFLIFLMYYVTGFPKPKEADNNL